MIYGTALGSVTGSCTLFNHRNRYYLVDCGAAVGGSAGDVSRFGFKPRGIDAVFLTHAHLDHCGMLPQLMREGFRGKVYCTRATADLTRVALLDAASLPSAQFSKAEVESLRFFPIDDREDFQFGKFYAVDVNLTVSLIRTSHVLGSVGFEFQFSNARNCAPGERCTIVFSGDIGCNVDGNWFQPLLNSRQYPSTHAEYLVCESTYGGRVRASHCSNYNERIRMLGTLITDAAEHGPGATVNRIRSG